MINIVIIFINIFFKNVQYALSKRTIITIAPLKYDIETGALPLISAKSLDVHYNKICTGFCRTANSVIQGIYSTNFHIGYIKIDFLFILLKRNCI